MSERLQKVLAAEGLGSRREIERWIVAGRLTINGEVASLGAKANLNDIIELDGKRLRLSSKAEPTRVIIYNKPEGEVSTRVDPEGRKTVFRLRHDAVGRGRHVVVVGLTVFYRPATVFS